MSNDIDVYKEWLGIPEGDRPPDHYTLLRLVEFEDDTERIQTNYRKLNAHVRKYATGQYLQQSQDLLNELAKAMLCLTDAKAKREYDASMGREPQSQVTGEPKSTLDFLVAQGKVESDQVEEIERFADARGLSVRDAVVQMKLVRPAEATRAMAAELGMPFVDLNDTVPEDDVLDLMPRGVIKRHSCVPLFEDNGKMLIACTDLPTPELEDEIRLRYGMPMRGVIAVPRAIQQAQAKYYAKGMRDESAASAGSAAKGGGAAKAKPAKKKSAAASPSSPEEKQKRQQVSIIIICWVLIGTIMGSNLTGFMDGDLFKTVPLGLVLAGVTAGILKLTYWK